MGIGVSGLRSKSTDAAGVKAGCSGEMPGGQHTFVMQDIDEECCKELRATLVNKSKQPPLCVSGKDWTTTKSVEEVRCDGDADRCDLSTKAKEKMSKNLPFTVTKYELYGLSSECCNAFGSTCKPKSYCEKSENKFK